MNTELENIVDDGTWGEILIQSPSIMTSYLKNPDATNSTILGGWLRTGDIGYQKDGKWYIVDRAKASFPQYLNTSSANLSPGIDQSSRLAGISY